jgi:hypothetical protein
MLPVATHREASAELIAAALYYDQHVPGLGADFLIRYDELIAAIRQRPRLWREVRRGLRKARMTRFPYAVYFELLADRIHILAVAHQHRRPYYWQSRTGD